MFVDVVGQERAVETLRRAAERPSHAYLLVGPRGSGVEDAGARVRGAADRCRAKTSAASASCSGVCIPTSSSSRPAARLTASRKTSAIRSFRRRRALPIEADRRVLILFEAERLRGNQNESANAMLKTIEEPPPRTIVVLVTSVADDLLPDHSLAVPTNRLRSGRRRGVARGTRTRRCGCRSRGDGGRALGRAARSRRAFAGPLAPMRAMFAYAPSQVDGTGAKAFSLAEGLGAAVDQAADAVTSRHEAELKEFDAELERLGYSDRDARHVAGPDREAPATRSAAHADRSAARRRDRDRDGLPRRAGRFRAGPQPGSAAAEGRSPRRRERARRVSRSARGVPHQREGPGAPHAPVALPASRPVTPAQEREAADRDGEERVTASVCCPLRRRSSSDGRAAHS